MKNYLLPHSRAKRVMGIEPTYPAWKAGVLPLNYTRMNSQATENACVYKAVGSRCRLLNAQSRNRTSDTRIFSPLLYQLSYLGPSRRVDMKSNSNNKGYFTHRKINCQGYFKKYCGNLSTVGPCDHHILASPRTQELLNFHTYC